MITPNTKYRPPIHGNNEELHQKQRQILAEKAKSKLLQQSTTIQRKNPPFQSEQENLVFFYFFYLFFYFFIYFFIFLFFFH